MATVKGVYNLIKDRQKKGIKIGVLEQAIVDAFEAVCLNDKAVFISGIRSD